MLQRQRVEQRQASQIALTRAENCVIVHHNSTTKHAPLTRNTMVWENDTTQVPLDDGTNVCNLGGTTAVVRGGKATNIATVQRADMKRFVEITNANSSKN